MCFHDDHTPHAVVVLMFQNIFTYGSIFKSLESKRKSNGRFFDASVLRRIKKKKKISFPKAKPRDLSRNYANSGTREGWISVRRVCSA